MRVNEIDNGDDNEMSCCRSFTQHLLTMARVRYNLRNKQDDLALIILIYRYNGKRMVHSTSLTIPLIHWNDREMRARETADNLDGDIVNDKLDKLEARIKKYIGNVSGRI